MTADKFSPRSLLATGLDWEPARNVEEGVGFPRKAVSASFVSTAAETITGIRPMMRKWGNGTIYGHVDICEAGSEVTGDALWSDTTVQAGLISFGSPACYPVNAATFQDALNFTTPDDNAYVVMPVSSGALVGVQFPPTVPSGQRILEVQIILYAHMFASYGFYTVQAYAANLAGTTPYKVPVGSFLPTIPGSSTPIVLSLGEIHPVLGVPFTQTNLANMSLGTSDGVAFSITWGGGGAGLLYAAGMRVFYAPENRKATSYFSFSNTTAETNAILMPVLPLVSPVDLSSGWAKAAAKTYTATFRHGTASNNNLAPGGGYSLGGVDGNPDAPLPPAGAAIRQLGIHGEVGAAATEAQLQPGWVFATDVLSPTSPERAYMLDLRRSDKAWSVDSQPYINVQNFGILAAPAEYPQQVFQLDSAYPAGTGFSQLAVQLVEFGNATAGVTIKFYVTSTVLGSVVLTADQIKAFPKVGLGTSAYTCLVDFNPPIVIPASSYCVITFSVDSADVSVGRWAINRLTVSGDNGRSVDLEPANVFGSSTTGNPVAKEGSYEGISTGWALMDATETSTTSFGDIPFTLYQAPPYPTNFTATLTEQVLNPVMLGDGSYMAPDAIPLGVQYSALTWTPLTVSDIPANQWGGYTVERLDNQDEGTWEQIAKITDQTVGFFNDYEARRGVQTSYRIRAFNTVRGSSVPSPVVSVTCGLAGCEMLFVSNEAPQMNLAYPPVWEGGDATPDWTFPESTEVAYKKFYGRDFDVAFFPQERRGVEFTRTVLIAAAHTTSPVGSDAFRPLRDLSRATLSYVCVLDSSGGRFFANLQVSAGTSKQPAGALLATVMVHEVTETPSAPDAKTL